MDEIICPICKGSCEEFFFDVNGEICGCDRCVTSQNALQYLQERAELEADYHREVWGSDR